MTPFWISKLSKVTSHIKIYLKQHNILITISFGDLRLARGYSNFKRLFMMIFKTSLQELEFLCFVLGTILRRIFLRGFCKYKMFKIMFSVNFSPFHLRKTSVKYTETERTSRQTIKKKFGLTWRNMTEIYQYCMLKCNHDNIIVFKEYHKTKLFLIQFCCATSYW